MKNLQELAKGIGINKSYLLRLSQNHNKCYKSYYIEKKSGAMRIIDAPNRELKAVQGWILRNILENQQISERAHGFIKGRGIKTNAKFHLNKHYIICLDIKDFFPSITEVRIYSIFNNIYDNQETVDVLSRLCTYKKRLPQGAVTSPMLSNIVFKKTDDEITQICNKIRVEYTRYADDLTFSANDTIRFKRLQPEIEEIITKYGFELNKKKTRFFSGRGRMLITGLLLNSGQLTIGRDRKRKIRAALYNYIVKKDESVNINKLAGMLAFIRDIEPDFYKKFLEYCHKLQSKD